MRPSQFSVLLVFLAAFGWGFCEAAAQTTAESIVQPRITNGKAVASERDEQEELFTK